MAKKGTYKKDKRRRPRKKRPAPKRRKAIAFRLSIVEEPLYPMNAVDEAEETHDGDEDADDTLSAFLHELPPVPTIRR